jgi:hypothetical protein
MTRLSLTLDPMGTMIIPAKSQFNWLSGFWQEDFLNFDQSEYIMGPGSHVGFPISAKNKILVSTRFVFLVLIWNPTWLPGSIMCSHWSKFKKSSCQKPLSQLNCDFAGMIIAGELKRWKCEIPIGSNVKLNRVTAAILNFRSANDSQI